EDLPTGWLEGDEPGQFIRVPLHHSEEVGDFPIQVVKDLDLGSGLMKEHLGSTSERLNVGGVFRDQRQKAPGDAAFAADIGERADYTGGHLSRRSPTSAVAAASAKGSCRGGWLVE